MPPRKKKKGAEERSRGLAAPEVAAGTRPATIAALEAQIRDDGGSVLGSFRDPLGGHWQLVAALPIEKVEPTPFQRDLSEAHVKRLAAVIDSLGRFATSTRSSPCAPPRASTGRPTATTASQPCGASARGP